MKIKQLLAAASLLGVASSGSLIAQDLANPDCAQVVKKLEADITKEPSRVLLAVEDALTTKESCACEIIQTAISVAKADPKLVGEIVSAAVNAAPAASSTIGECALKASPESSKEIKKAMENALGQAGGDTGSGKEPVAVGKEPVGKEPVGKEPLGKDVVTAPPAQPTEGPDDFFGAPMDVRGIYLASPSSGGGGEKKSIIKIIRTEKQRRKHRPPTGSTPATGS